VPSSALEVAENPASTRWCAFPDRDLRTRPGVSSLPKRWPARSYNVDGHPLRPSSTEGNNGTCKKQQQ